jgi:hypothetical protein
LAEDVDLIAHERNERRDHNADAGTTDGGDLVAQGLTSTGRHQNDGVATIDDVLNDRLLLAPDTGQTEHRF